jgi:hypothetical protein
MTRRTAAAAFHQFGNILLAVAASSFVLLPLASIVTDLIG